MNKSDLQKDIKSARLNVKIIDAILFMLVVSTISQLADVFGQGRPIWSDWFKAGGFAMVELYFARMVSRAFLTKTKAWPLWTIMFLVMILIIPLNLIYAWSKAHHSSFGKYTAEIISNDIVINYLAGIGSGLISLMIAGMSIVRLIAEKSIGIAEVKYSEFIELSQKRKENRDRQRDYRKRLDAELRANPKLDSAYIEKMAGSMLSGGAEGKKKKGRPVGWRKNK